MGLAHSRSYPVRFFYLYFTLLYVIFQYIILEKISSYCSLRSQQLGQNPFQITCGDGILPRMSRDFVITHDKTPRGILPVNSNCKFTVTVYKSFDSEDFLYSVRHIRGINNRIMQYRCCTDFFYCLRHFNTGNF